MILLFSLIKNVLTKKALGPIVLCAHSVNSLGEATDGRTLSEEDIIQAMEDDIALILLPSVLYRSGQILDMKRLTVEAHKRGIHIGFDLCHSILLLPV